MLRKLPAAFVFLGLSFGMAMTGLQRQALALEEGDGDVPQSVDGSSAAEGESAEVVEGTTSPAEETPVSSSEAPTVEETPASADSPPAEEAPPQVETPSISEEATPASTEENAPEVRDLRETIGDSIGTSIVQVLVMGRGNEVRRAGTGFVVADQRVLTTAHLAPANRQIAVVPLTTKAQMIAAVLHANEAADLALLSVGGLDLAPLKFAKDGFAPGRVVLSGGVWRDGVVPFLVADAEGDVAAVVTQGAVGLHGQLTLASDWPAATLIRHNAMVPAAGYGGPLLNDCGEVVGVNRLLPDASGSWLRRPQAPDGVVYALGVTAIVGLLQPLGVAVQQSETSCVDARVEAEGRAGAARREAEQAREQAGIEAERAERAREEAAIQAEAKDTQLQQRQAQLEEANRRLAELEREHQDAVRRGEAAEALNEQLRIATEAVQQAQIALDEEERLREESEQKGHIQLLIVIALAIAAVVLVAIIMHRRRSHQVAIAQDQAARAQREAQRHQIETRRSRANLPDCVLSGETGDGRSISLKVPGSMLDSGVVIGRSPRNSTFLIDDKTLSREHARLFGDHNRLCIEDLGTTNGTRVNGRELSPNGPATVRRGDLLELGAVRLRVAWKN